ncbi:hypothetical protein L208DRAFT_411122 [Tricholoma matsutake]|nr:hypothetical protein L208DRAFT_411122 [Tricholoma matsutake 945]
MQDLSKGSSSISQPKRTWRWAPLIPTDEEFHAALQVLHYVLATFSATNLDISGSGSINFRSAPRNKHTTQTRKRTRLCILTPIASSSLILQPSFNLMAKTALITGARVNLSFHTVLRLFRCGASIIASTRYPHDAESRYFLQLDSHPWKDQLPNGKGPVCTRGRSQGVSTRVGNGEAGPLDQILADL